jgi:hypothetical protein
MDEIENSIEWLWIVENSNKPLLLQVMTDSNTNTYPKLLLVDR